MRCDQARDRIGALVDGELPAGEREAVIAHAAAARIARAIATSWCRLRHHLQQARETGAAQAAGPRVGAIFGGRGRHGEPVLPGLASRHHADGVVRRALHRLRSAPGRGGAARLRDLDRRHLVVCSGRRAGNAVSRDVLAAHVRSLLQDNPSSRVARHAHGQTVVRRPAGIFAGRSRTCRRRVSSWSADGSTMSAAGASPRWSTGGACTRSACSSGRRQPSGTGVLCRPGSTATICSAGARPA